MQSWAHHDVYALPAVTLPDIARLHASVVKVTCAVQERVQYEVDALRQEAELCPQHVPEVYHYDQQYALIVMQYLAPPHMILRKVKRMASSLSSCTWGWESGPCKVFDLSCCSREAAARLGYLDFQTLKGAISDHANTIRTSGCL